MSSFNFTQAWANILTNIRGHTAANKWTIENKTVKRKVRVRSILYMLFKSGIYNEVVVERYESDLSGTLFAWLQDIAGELVNTARFFIISVNI